MACRVTTGPVTVEIDCSGRTPCVTVTSAGVVKVVRGKPPAGGGAAGGAPPLQAGEFYEVEFTDSSAIVASSSSSDDDDDSDDADFAPTSRGHMLVVHIGNRGDCGGLWVYGSGDITTRNIPKKAHLSNHTYTANASQLMRLCHGFKVEPNLLDVHSKPMSTVDFLPVPEVVAAAKAGRMPTDDDVYLSRYTLKTAMDKLAAQRNDKRKR